MKNSVLLFALFVVSMLLAPVSGWGQGWERVYDFGGEEIGRKVLETQDHRLIVAATQEEFVGSDKAIRLSEVDAQGQLVWSKTSPVTGIYDIVFLHERADGAIVMVTMENDSAVTKTEPVYRLFSSTGDFVEKKVLEMPNTPFIWVYDVCLSGDTMIMTGGCRQTDYTNPFLARVSLDGDLVAFQQLGYFPDEGISSDEYFFDIELGEGDHFWVAHLHFNPTSIDQWRLLKLNSAGDSILAHPLVGDEDVYQCKIKTSDSCLVMVGAQPLTFHSFVKKIDSQGNTLKKLNLALPFSAEQASFCKTENGGFALLMERLPNWPQNNYADIGLIRFDQDLNWLWDKQYYQRNYNFGHDIISTSSGGLFIAGNTGSHADDLYLILTDSLGNSITNLIAGQVQWDQDKDCIEQPADPGLKNWIVTATSPTDTFYRSTAPDGSYALRVDTGHFTVRVRPLNSLWDTECSVLDTTLTQLFDTIQHNFPVRATVDCPGMEVSTAVAGLRPCLPANLQVWWCNNGTVTAEDAQIQLVLNEYMTYDSASLPPAQVSGDTLWFALGDVEPFECGNFFVRVLVDCDTTLLGQTLCYTAHAYPDTTCLPPSEWSGAQVVTIGYCEGDSVRLVLRNIGTAATTQGLEYIIVEDNVIMMQTPFWLPPGDSIILKVKANGATWRLIAQQEPNFPHGFFSTVALEGCHEGSGQFSTGFVNQFPSGDAAPWLDEECRVVTGSYDPNDKSAVPEGYGEQHFVAANTDLEYLIRFQNTGTDTAFQVIIRDQISPFLDPASVQPGAASHPYTWSLSGTGELTFTFSPIALPDSGANLAASQGFVQFRISQRPNLPPNTRFENRAAIYFDFNAPVITNTVFHTIKPLFKQTSGVLRPVFAESEKLKVWPNPADEVTYISFKDKALSPRKLSLYDLSGRLASVAFSSENTVAVQRGGLPAGAYVLKVEQRGKQAQVAVVLWR